MPEVQITPGAASPAPHGWAVFTAAPHRVLFFAGAAQLIAVMTLWSVELLARARGGTLPMVVPAAAAHLFLMVYGLFPFFMLGFLLTVYPRWMAGPVVPRAEYVRLFLLLAAGVLVFYLGLFTHRFVLAAGLLLWLAGWGTATRALLHVYREAPHRGPHEQVLNFALFAAPAGAAGYLYALLAGDARGLALAREIGLWLFLVPVVYTVSHRMIPFFSQSALPDYRPVRPPWGLPLVGACALGHVALELAGLSAWRFAFDLPLAAAAWRQTLLWNLRRSFEVRLLAMLHVAFLWLGIAATLYGTQSLWLLLSGSDAFGRAPLHALGVGFLAGMVVAMASRVTLGHSGRPLEADALTWRCFLGVNATAVVRVLAEFLPGAWRDYANLLAALAWLACLVPWVSRYAPIVLRPRADGKPG